MIPALSALAALVVIALAVAIALLDWGGKVGMAQRVGLCLMTAGLIWAAPARYLGYGPSLGDLTFMVGIVVYIAAMHGPAVLRGRIAALDAIPDGWIGHGLRPEGPASGPPPEGPRPTPKSSVTVPRSRPPTSGSAIKPPPGATGRHPA